MQGLFRNKDGEVVETFCEEESLNYQASPLDIFIVLARYKFAARHLKGEYKVADVGIGQGIGSVMLSKFAGEVVGLDYDKALVDRCNKTYAVERKLRYELFDLLDPNPQMFGIFDAVISNDVIEHFSLTDMDQVIKTYKNLLANNGFAIIGTPNIASQKYASRRRLSTHQHEFEAEEYRSLLEKHFSHVFLFGMNDEIVSTQFLPMSWYLMAICCP